MDFCERTCCPRTLPPTMSFEGLPTTGNVYCYEGSLSLVRDRQTLPQNYLTGPHSLHCCRDLHPYPRLGFPKQMNYPCPREDRQ
eukprot:scaffold1170_cov122-Cylindrotheca_fusiformis.AAC.31